MNKQVFLNPTSIFVAGKIGTPWGLYILTAVVVVITDIYFIIKRKNMR